jgi:hypothetical protein
MAKLNLWLAAALVCALWPSAFAQNAISAKAGLVQVADGEVFVNDKAVEHKVAQFTDLKSKDTLTTGEGRAEVLLTPGAFLRMTDSSGVRMTSTRLSDVRMDMLKGEAVIEVAELLTDNSITVNVGTAAFELRKGGIYRFDAEPGRIRVYQGEAVAAQGEKTVTVKAGHEFANNGSAWALGRFDTNETDALYRWSSRRSGNIAVANVSAARQAGSSYGSNSGYMNSGMYGSGMYGYGNGMYGYGNGMYGNGMYGAGGSWMYNPYFGMYTFMPFNGTAFSPFGYAYYTPITVVPVYAYTPVQGGGGAPVTKVGPGRGTPGTGGPVHSALPVRTTPALTSSASMHTSAITRGGGGSSHVGFTGGNGNYGGGYSGNSSYSGTSTANNSVSNSVSSAPARSAGGGGAASSGGGGATRTH